MSHGSLNMSQYLEVLFESFNILFLAGDEFGEPIIAERMIRIADNPTSKGAYNYK